MGDQQESSILGIMYKGAKHEIRKIKNYEIKNTFSFKTSR